MNKAAGATIRVRSRALPASWALGLALAVGLLAGCTGDTTTTVTSVTTETGGPATTTPVTVSSGAEPYFMPDYVAPQPVDLDTVGNLDAARLSDEARTVLARQGFVSTDDPDGWVPQKFWHVYEENRYGGIPSLVTTDALLNSYHTVFDLTLQRLEEQAFFEQAETMSETLQDAASGYVGEAAGTAMEDPALATEAYFAVGNSLLKGGLTAPERVRGLVEAEIALIESAAGMQTSPILGYDEDYSQYKPRGHYTRSERLERYFKAMMWYGHTAFWADPKAPDVTEELARRLTRQAALITMAMSGEAEEAWRALYEPTAFLVGAADDLTADDMRPAMGVAFGTQTPTPAQLADDALIDALRAEIRKLPAPMIQSHPNWAPPGDSREEGLRGFRVMGQRYIPDSYAFQQLVWTYVGSSDDKRMLPMGLDVMAALGSDQAYELLTTTYAQQEYDHYVDQLMKVKEQFDTRSPTFWPPTIYTYWLDALRLNFAFPPEEAPALMRTKAWARKTLNASLGSWTELRHDTILYAKQSVASEGDGGEMEVPPGYVEPYPALYYHLASLAVTTGDGLEKYGLLDEDVKAKLQTMHDLCTDLEQIAIKELAGQPLDEREADVIRWFGSTLEQLELFYDAEGRTMSPTDEKSPVVADVHTDLNDGVVLEEGTGYPALLYVVLDLDGTPSLLRGAAYEYYEFTTKIAGRLTDEEWQATLDAGTQPPRPVWTDEFIVRAARAD